VLVEVVFDPKFLDSVEADFSGLQNGVYQPDVLAEGVGISHN